MYLLSAIPQRRQSILRPLRLVLARLSRPRSVIIALKVVRSDRRRRLRRPPRRRRSSLVFLLLLLPRRRRSFHDEERRGTVTLWPGSGVRRDLG